MSGSLILRADFHFYEQIFIEFRILKLSKDVTFWCVVEISNTNDKEQWKYDSAKLHTTNYRQIVFKIQNLDTEVYFENCVSEIIYFERLLVFLLLQRALLSKVGDWKVIED